MMNWWRKAFPIAAATLLLAVTPLHAASLRMSPIGLDLTAPEKAGAISLTNTSDEPVNLQIRIFKWTQVDGKDVLTETRDVLVSPPATTIKAEETYTLRVVRTASQPVSGEETYRLVIDELPKPIDPRAPAQGVRMVLRTSMPIFFADKAAIADIRFTSWRSGDKYYIEAFNAGARHVKLAGITLSSPDGEVSFGSGLNGYVLAGQTMRFESAADTRALVRPGAATLITGKGSSLDLRKDLVIEAR
ncbi:MAG: molecular chaperone [Variovorax sp.]|jgi:fimbrial chaperone protein|nr:MAG: molecular chaperone [Variovorax sp.]